MKGKDRSSKPLAGGKLSGALPSSASRVVRQRGASLIQLVFYVVLASFSVVATVRLAPIYMDAWKVRSVVNSMGSETALRGASAREVSQSLNRRLNINGIRHIERDHIAIQVGPGGTEVVIDYEVRVPLFGNLDAIAHFRYDTVISN
ncbi:DUF4845 domain-containing protein [Alkalilimnicola ehrlichii]|nr:DUF4845 domain-containing protein [Alkalilimnicola ehrlichii]